MSCGITIRRRTDPLTVASSDARSSAVNEVQHDLDEGPFLQALSTGHPVSVPDLFAERRQDGYPAHALAHGVGGSLSLPISSGEHTSEALNLHSAPPHAFGDSLTLARATAFAAQASAVLTVALHQAEQTQLTTQLR